MNTRIRFSKSLLLTYIILFSLCSVGCTTDAGPCPAQPYKDLSDAELFAQDITLPFRFPLNDANSYLGESATFCTSGRDRLEAPYKYHAAEDYFQPAGTPVYAMADGEVSFSGPMGGYGWLIIIDHPQANIYSLYGHLSPSRWRLGTGPVSKGDLIAYLGDPHENGGSLKQPLKPHLHLGIRSGQRSDYPGNGEWRWMAGWIHPCPANLGWLRPSEVIAGQEIPGGGYPKPEGDFLTMWGVETLFGLIYSAGALGAFVYGTRKNTPIPLIMSGSIMLFAGWYFFKDGWRISPILFILAALLIIPGIKRFIAQRKSVI